MADKDSHSIDRSVLGAVKKVILTTIVLTHIRIFTRLILILMRNRYSYIFWFSLWHGLWAPDYAAKLHKNAYKSYSCCTICIFLHQTLPKI